MSAVLITTLLLGFYMAWNIGANDVANAMGTSVGSKALTLKKAVIIAAFLEFGGAFFVGSSVSETIQHGIVSPAIFEGTPEIFVLGMMGSLLATGALLQLASYFALPISTTHAIVGAVIGFGAVIGGMDAVNWNEVGWISASWIVSPLLSGLIAHLLFRLIHRLRNRIELLAPCLVFLCINTASMSISFNPILSLTASLSAALIAHRLVQRIPVSAGNISIGFPREKVFVYLQILTACMVAFAHGANDVANAIGPVAAVLSVLKTNSLHSHAQIPSWLLALGGGGIVLGLATWGWRVIETIGKKITELSPMRGFCAEFGAAATILLASRLGLPISTTHALVGAVFGVGMARGIESLNLQTLKEIVVSWIVTIPLCALLSVAAFYLLRLTFL